MRVFYTPHYYAEIGDSHIFPIRKFQYVRDRLLAEGTLKSDHFSEPTPAAIEEVLLVHTEDYVSRLCTGTLNAKELRRLGLPWSQSLVQRSFFATGGTICAAREALETGVASNLAGGTHHAFTDHGEGFCVLNDVAVAIEVLRREHLARRFAVIDCDVHQGNGTANIFEEDESVFTFSMHGAKNYPLFKARSTLDVELPDGTGDHRYLELLDANLAAVFAHDPQIVFYLGGADPFVGDKLGRLSLTIEGLKERDRRVLNECFEREVPVATVMSGGYGEHLEDTIEIHCNTIRSVMSVFGGTEAAQVKVGQP